MTIQIDSARLEEVMAWPLKSGNHKSNRNGELCVMEAAAYVAGERWSDHPQCTCPVITTFMVAWNDRLPSDEDRARLLKPLIAKVIGTRSTPEVEKRRGMMALDWLIRVHTPAWLDRVEALKPHAATLRDLEEIADTAGVVAATGKLESAASAARAAGAAARAAARDAAWDAAEAAAWAAAGAAAWAAARDAAWDAAEAAAEAAAWAAARDAARDALKPTVEWLQISAVQLVERMCAAG